jgi:hypothetical protein
MKSPKILLNALLFLILLWLPFSQAVAAPSLTWASYFGGSAIDNGRCVAVDASGNIYICGSTSSTSGISTSGAYQTSMAGSSDAFLAKFSSSGSLLWATYFGGSGSESAAGLAIDNSGNIYIVGYTASSSGIATSGAYKTTFGGTYDAFLAKFNSSGSLLWSTYYGGSDDDEGEAIALDGSGNIFIAGISASTSGIATAGAFQTAFGGIDDAFLAKFNSSGTLSWATYYGGSGIENGFSLTTDTGGHIYLSGNTGSSTGIATPGAYQTSLSGIQDGFLVKFSGSGARTWATYYGGSGSENPEQICTDDSGNIFMTGFTTSSSGIATTGAYMTAFGGGTNDAYLAKFTSSGSLSWATYFGASGNEWGIASAVNKSGEVYIAGATTSTSGIATSGAYLTTYGGASREGMLAKFSSDGSSLSWASYYGGNGYTSFYGIALDTSGNIYFAGYTASTTAITTSGAYQAVYGGGGYDAFLGVFHDTASAPSPPSYRPVITATSPVNHATGVNPSNPLTITFNRNISKGSSGNIYIRNEDAHITTTKAVTSSDVTVSGKIATISGLSLAANTNYHVTFDSVCFDTASYNSYGLYDTTAWKFKTAPAVVKKKGKKGVELSVVDPAASNQLNIMATLEEPGNYDLMVYDLTGRVIYNKIIELHSGDQKISLTDLQLTKSMYVLRISNGSAYDAIKFVVN